MLCKEKHPRISEPTPLEERRRHSFESSCCDGSPPPSVLSPPPPAQGSVKSGIMETWHFHLLGMNAITCCTQCLAEISSLSPGMFFVSSTVSHPEAVLGESGMGVQEDVSDCEGCSALPSKIDFTACNRESSAESEQANGPELPTIRGLLLMEAEILALPSDPLPMRKSLRKSTRKSAQCSRVYVRSWGSSHFNKCSVFSGISV